MTHIKPSPGKQLSRKMIRKKLTALGVLEYFDKAAAGDVTYIHRLRRLAKCNTEVKSALLLLQPRKNTDVGSNTKKTWNLDKASQLATGYIQFVQGGAPGLKK